jgi:A/G-specific adenine glycosylase
MAKRQDLKRVEQRRRLLDWFDAQQRDLPWRRSSTAYPVWVSEIMLQQTRVETARPYFERFLDAFPSVEDLAAAKIEAVLSQWSGLGYYQRARRLHAAARQIVESGGIYPTTVEGWRQLPGVGPYTAAAIASIVLGIPEPAIDGNVMRVVARLLALETDPKKKSGSRAVASKARDLLDVRRPGDSNQAIMEIGAIAWQLRRVIQSAIPSSDAGWRSSASADRWSWSRSAVGSSCSGVRRTAPAWPACGSCPG